MKILLFGGDGQLGFEIKKKAFDLNFNLIAPVISEVDISNFDQVKRLTHDFIPDIVVNCAAYTAVDNAENDQDTAFLINKVGAQNVAVAAQDCGARVVHISTDYVFPGDTSTALTENAPTCPLNVYGISKLAGEDDVLSATNNQALILRTSSLFGLKGPNFIATMLKLFSSGRPVKIVSDQVMSPTWAGWLAEVILDLCRIKCSGIINACCSGEVSWYDFAVEAYKLSGGEAKYPARTQLVPIFADDFIRPAKRPKYSVLNCSKLTSILGRAPISWQDGLRGYLKDCGLV